MRMPDLRTILRRIVLHLLVLGAGTYFVLFVLEIAALPVAPLQSYLACPLGATLETAWVQEPWDRPGQTTLVKSCLDGAGQEQPAFSNDAYNQRQYNLFMPISIGSMLLLEAGWLWVRTLRRRGGASTTSDVQGARGSG